MVAAVAQKNDKAKSKKTNKAAAKKVDRAVEYGMEKSKDLPMCEKKAKILKAIKKLGEADSSAICKATGLTGRDVRHYAYHAKAGGLVEINQYERDEEKDFGGTNKYYFKLTAAGKKLDVDKELAAVAAKKSEKKAPKADKAPKAGKGGKKAVKK